MIIVQSIPVATPNDLISKSITKREDYIARDWGQPGLFTISYSKSAREKMFKKPSIIVTTTTPTTTTTMKPKKIANSKSRSSIFLSTGWGPLGK